MSKEKSPQAKSADKGRHEENDRQHRPEKWNGGHRIAIAIRWFLAVVLIWAGLSKLVDATSFYGAILAYRLPLPESMLKLIAVVLPWMEILCGLLLVSGSAGEAANLWSCVLFATFLLIVGQALLRGLQISCGCFNLGPLGISEDSKIAYALESTGFAFLRNVVFFAAALALWRCSAFQKISSEPVES